MKCLWYHSIYVWRLSFVRLAQGTCGKANRSKLASKAFCSTLKGETSRLPTVRIFPSGIGERVFLCLQGRDLCWHVWGITRAWEDYWYDHSWWDISKNWQNSRALIGGESYNDVTYVTQRKAISGKKKFCSEKCIGHWLNCCWIRSSSINLIWIVLSHARDFASNFSV